MSMNFGHIFSNNVSIQWLFSDKNFCQTSGIHHSSKKIFMSMKFGHIFSNNDSIKWLFSDKNVCQTSGVIHFLKNINVYEFGHIFQ